MILKSEPLFFIVSLSVMAEPIETHMSEYYNAIPEIHVDTSKMQFDPKELNVLVVCPHIGHHSRIMRCSRSNANRIARQLFQQGMTGVMIIEERDFLPMVQRGQILIDPRYNGPVNLYPRNLQESLMFANTFAKHEAGMMAPATRAKF